MRWFISSCFVATLALPGLCAAQEAVPKVIDLRSAISEALRHSPQLSAADDAADTADIQRRLALSAYRPAITPTLNTGSAPAGFSQQNMALSVSQLLPTGGQVRLEASAIRYGIGAAEMRDAGYTFGISQPLRRMGGPERDAVRTAEQGFVNAQRASADARRQLVVSVAQTYFAVVRQRRLVDISDQAVERADRLAEMSEYRARVGLSTQLDVFRARLLRSQAQMAVMRDRDALETAIDDLTALVGRTPPSRVTAEGDLAADMATFEQLSGTTADAAAVAAVDVTKETLHNRVDLQIVRAKLTDARWKASAARGNLLPPVSLDVSYTRRGFGSAADYFTGLNGWRVGLSSTYALDRRQESATAATAAIGVREAEHAMADAEQRAVAEVRRTSRALLRTADTVELQRQAVQLAEQQRDLAAFRYERGLADNLEVVDAENAVAQAKAAVLAAEIDRTLTFIVLERASGALDPNRFLH